jgi:hypothetical protein
MMQKPHNRAPRNRTLTCTEAEIAALAPTVTHLSQTVATPLLVDRIVQQDLFEAMRYLGIEQNLEYCCWAQKRLNRVATDPSIQGYADGVFWERNSLSDQKSQNQNTNFQKG